MNPRGVKKSAWSLIAVATWFLFVIVCLTWVDRSELKAGKTANAGPSWPANTLVRLKPGMPTLVMLVHPQCPCSHASVEELARIMTHCQGKLRAIVLFVNPGKFDDAWVHSGLWQEAVGIPAVEVRVDPNGHDAKLLGAISSGQALLFDQNNKLVFNGGITESRGHFGANPGSDSVIAWVNSKVCPAKTTPVFGCELLDPINCAKNVANR